MMNNILFTKKTNKQKNIENAVIYCIHIPLNQLITADCTIQEGKMVKNPGVSGGLCPPGFPTDPLETLRGSQTPRRLSSPLTQNPGSAPVCCHSFLWYIVLSLSVEANLCKFFLLIFYICIVIGDPIIIGGGGFRILGTGADTLNSVQSSYFERFHWPILNFWTLQTVEHDGNGTRNSNTKGVIRSIHRRRQTIQ
jgi:hypothetical protein